MFAQEKNPLDFPSGDGYRYVLPDYTGKTTKHELSCGCILYTYQARDSITLRIHRKRCRKIVKTEMRYVYG